jgi:molybdopterin molybdotransferase
LGLPGNPLSAFVTWHLFGRAILDELSGRVRSGSSRRYVVVGNEIRHRPGRCELRPARLSGYDGSGREIAICETATHSARVARLPDADGLLFIPSSIGRMSEGDLIEFWPLAED